MKGIDIFCASQAATAICLSMEELGSSSSSPSSSSTNFLLAGAAGGGGGGGRAIDRHNPIIRDSRRIPKTLNPPCTNASQPPLSPKPTHKINQIKKKHHKLIPSKENRGDRHQPKKKDNVTNKPEDEKIKKDDGEIIITTTDGKTKTSTVRKSWSCTKPGDFISPPGSTRYLLSDNVLVNPTTDFDPSLKIFPEEISKSEAVKADDDESCDGKPPSSSPSSDTPEQVVVLRVSLHCRGCERKMRKHISRMEGVTSFNVDFMAKKVTVTGKVTPLSVLSSISKVKNAQLWPPAISSSSSSNIPPAVNFSDSAFMQNEYTKGLEIIN